MLESTLKLRVHIYQVCIIVSVPVPCILKTHIGNIYSLFHIRIPWGGIFFFKWGNDNSEKVNNLTKIPQWASDRAGTQTQVFPYLRPVPSIGVTDSPAWMTTACLLPPFMETQHIPNSSFYHYLLGSLIRVS